MAKTESQASDRVPSRRSSAPILWGLGIAGLGFIGLCGCGVGAWILTLVAINPTPEQWDQRVKDNASQRWKDEDQRASSDQYRG